MTRAVCSKGPELKGSGIVVVGTLDNSAVFANALSLARCGRRRGRPPRRRLNGRHAGV